MAKPINKGTGYNTAITRTQLSLPAKEILAKHNLTGKAVLDYGCGRGFDADQMGWDKYDPNWGPTELDPNKKYDFILCIYVLNVIKDREKQKEVIEDVKKRLKPGGTAFFAVRRDLKKDTETQVAQCDFLMRTFVLRPRKYLIYEIQKSALGEDHGYC